MREKDSRFQRLEGAERMEGNETMTDYQFRAIVKMILEILKGCETIPEAENKIRELLEEKA